jgi:hypothetical protein
MNTYFQSLLHPVRKRKRLFCVKNEFFPLLSSQFSGRIINEFGDTEIRIEIGVYRLTFIVGQNSWNISVVDRNFYYSCSYDYDDKDDLNLNIFDWDFKGLNIFMRLEERTLLNLISFLK